MDSISLPRKEFERELCTAIHGRDQAAFYAHLLASPSLPCTSASMRDQDSGSTCSAALKDSRQPRFGFSRAVAHPCCVNMTAALGTSPTMTERTASV